MFVRGPFRVDKRDQQECESIRRHRLHQIHCDAGIENSESVAMISQPYFILCRERIPEAAEKHGPLLRHGDLGNIVLVEACLTRTWGRIGSPRSRACCNNFETESEAVRSVSGSDAAQKRKRGYGPRRPMGKSD